MTPVQGGGDGLGILLTPRIFLFLPPDNSIQSVITFDRGGEWVPLRKPKNTTCDSTARSKEEVGLSPPGASPRVPGVPSASALPRGCSGGASHT